MCARRLTHETKIYFDSFSGICGQARLYAIILNRSGTAKRHQLNQRSMQNVECVWRIYKQQKTQVLCVLNTLHLVGPSTSLLPRRLLCYMSKAGFTKSRPGLYLGDQGYFGKYKQDLTQLLMVNTTINIWDMTSVYVEIIRLVREIEEYV